MLRFDKLTIKAQEIVEKTVSRSRALKQQQIETEHLLASLLDTEDTIVVPLLQKLGVDTDVLLKDIEQLIAKKPSVSGAEVREYFSPNLEQVFDAAQKEADAFKDQFISTEHLFLGLFNDTRPEIQTLFKRYNI